MDSIAILEILGRQKEVVRIERINRFPFTLGRAYDNEVIIDDPFLAPHHIRIECDEQGFTAIDLGTKNGMHSIPSKTHQRKTRFDGDTILRLGHTQIRLRSQDYEVPPEKVTMPERPFRKQLIFVLALTAVLIWGYTEDHLTRINPPDFEVQVATQAFIMLGFLTWGIAWSTAGKILCGKWMLLRYGTLACLTLIIYDLTVWLVSLCAFSFSWTAIARFSYMPVALIMVIVVYYHTTLISRSSAKHRIIVSFLLTLLLFTGGWSIGNYENDKDWNAIEQYVELWPSSMLFVQGKSIEQFFLQTESLKQKAEGKRNESN